MVGVPSCIPRELNGEGAPWRVLHGEGARWGGSSVGRVLHGGCSMGRVLYGGGARWGGCSEEEAARQLLTPLLLGARQSKEGQKAAGLGVRQAGVWIPAQQLEPM